MNNIIFGNVRGLHSQYDKTKPSILLDLAKIKNAFALSLVETHLTDSISSCEILREAWDVYRTDRLSRYGGGVAIYLI